MIWWQWSNKPKKKWSKRHTTNLCTQFSHHSLSSFSYFSFWLLYFDSTSNGNKLSHYVYCVIEIGTREHLCVWVWMEKQKSKEKQHQHTHAHTIDVYANADAVHTTNAKEIEWTARCKSSNNNHLDFFYGFFVVVVFFCSTFGSFSAVQCARACACTFLSTQNTIPSLLHWCRVSSAECYLADFKIDESNDVLLSKQTKRQSTSNCLQLITYIEHVVLPLSDCRFHWWARQSWRLKRDTRRERERGGGRERKMIGCVRKSNHDMEKGQFCCYVSRAAVFHAQIHFVLSGLSFSRSIKWRNLH